MKIIMIIFGCLATTEILLRTQLGFCDTVLMQVDSNFEYIAIPSQNVKRFGNYVVYNTLSMRGDEVSNKAIKFLGLGDSVINGGALTDQDALATEVLSTRLTNLFQKEIQFLNVSAGSWGPDNCYAYVSKNGHFESKAIFLVVSSHDAYDNMVFEPIVGIDESFPDTNYKIALIEMFDRYLIPEVQKRLNLDNNYEEYLYINKKKDNSCFNSGFYDLNIYCKSQGIPFIIYLHADKDELQVGSYNDQGKQIIDFAMNNDIPIIMDLYDGLSEDEFRDKIHLNEKGQMRIANSLYSFIINKNLL